MVVTKATKALWLRLRGWRARAALSENSARLIKRQRAPCDSDLALATRCLSKSIVLGEDSAQTGEIHAQCVRRSARS